MLNYKMVPDQTVDKEALPGKKKQKDRISVPFYGNEDATEMY